MSLYAILFGLLCGQFNDLEFVKKYGFWTWMTIVNQALAGLIVAMVVKYSDNILKGFATSISIIVSCIVSKFIFHFQVNYLFIFGASLVLMGKNSLF